MKINYPIGFTDFKFRENIYDGEINQWIHNVLPDMIKNKYERYSTSKGNSLLNISLIRDIDSNPIYYEVCVSKNFQRIPVGLDGEVYSPVVDNKNERILSTTEIDCLFKDIMEFHISNYIDNGGDIDKLKEWLKNN